MVSGHSGVDAMDRADQVAVKMLDRVKVMRVFDFAGVVEAIGEVGEMWEKLDRDQVTPADKTTAVFNPDDEIPNSQDSDDSEERKPSRATGNKPQTAPAVGIGMIVIDNIANPISSIMAKSQVQGTPISFKPI